MLKKYTKKENKKKSSIPRYIIFLILSIIMGGIFTTLTSYAATIAASNISYSNTTSGLTATNAQDAIDELLTFRKRLKTIDNLELGTTLYLGGNKCILHSTKGNEYVVACKTEIYTDGRDMRWGVSESDVISYLTGFCKIHIPAGYYDKYNSSPVDGKTFYYLSVSNGRYDLSNLNGEGLTVGQNEDELSWLGAVFNEYIQCYAVVGKSQSVFYYGENYYLLMNN